MSLVVRTLSKPVFEVVRDQIVKARLPNGEAIRQDALANELGISKIPLREALARAGEGRPAHQPSQSRLLRVADVARASPRDLRVAPLH